VSRERNQPKWHHSKEIVAIVGIGLCVLLLLSIYTYDSGDISFYMSPPYDPPHNAVGWLGAQLGFIFFFLFGVSSFVVPFLCLIPAVNLVFQIIYPELKKNPWSWIKVLWAFVFLFTLACLSQLFFPHLMKSNYGLEGSGGYIGVLFVGGIFFPLLGKSGAAIILGITYLISLVMMLEFKPITLTIESFRWVRDYIRNREDMRIEREEDPRERVKLMRKRAERLSKEAEKLSKSKQREIDEEILRQEEAIRMEEREAAMIQAEAVPQPPPQIIDTTISPVRKKISEDGDEDAPDEIPGDDDQVGAKAMKASGKDRKTPVGGRSLSKEPVPAVTLANVSYKNYELPSLDLLQTPPVPVGTPVSNEIELLGQADILVNTLKQFGITVYQRTITKGPTITRFELEPEAGVKLEKIVSLEKNMAMALQAEAINILAPIPGKNTVGVEVANSKKVTVFFTDLLTSDTWVNSKAKIPVALGKDVYGNIVVGDLAEMPHVLVAGTTGSGKSVCISSIILSMLYKFSPENLRLIMIDPKVVEMQVYNKLPHLVVPVVTDPKKVIRALQWVVREMEKRYQIFAAVGVRNISTFNDRPKPKIPIPEPLDLQEVLEKEDDEDGAGEGALGHKEQEPEVLPIVVPRDDDLIIPDKMPYIVVIIDELADLMQTAPADVESLIARITQMARAAGIHMLIATQTPRADVVTGVIKANVPTRIALQVASKLDSRVILDANGADKLLGKGDMLYLPPGSSKLIRAQGAYITDEEVSAVVDYISKQAPALFEPEVHSRLEKDDADGSEITDEDKRLVQQCLEIALQEGRASTSLLQRRLRLGYTRAARIMDIFEDYAIVGPKDGAKDREILVDLNNPDEFRRIEALFD